MKQWKRKKSYRGKSAPFQPNREYINRAVEEYLKSGGEIKPLFVESRNLEVSSKLRLTFEADEFLLGKYNR